MELASQFAAAVRDHMARQRLAERHPDLLDVEELFDMRDYLHESDMNQLMQK